MKRADKRRVDDLRLEVGVKESVKKKLARRWLVVKRMRDNKLAKGKMPRKWKAKGGEEDRECDGRIALREI